MPFHYFTLINRRHSPMRAWHRLEALAKAKLRPQSETSLLKKWRSMSSSCHDHEWKLTNLNMHLNTAATTSDIQVQNPLLAVSASKPGQLLSTFIGKPVLDLLEFFREATGMPYDKFAAAQTTLPLIVRCPSALHLGALDDATKPTIQVQLESVDGQVYLVPLSLEAGRNLIATLAGWPPMQKVLFGTKPTRYQ
jgi:hypothetical protein